LPHCCDRQAPALAHVVCAVHGPGVNGSRRLCADGPPDGAVLGGRARPEPPPKEREPLAWHHAFAK